MKRKRASMMSLEVRPCKADELAGVVERLDGEFVHAKGRGLSLAARFPHTVSAGNLEGIRVAVDGGRLLGANAIRFFDWNDGGRLWRGAMVGMVWVAPEARGRGVGTRLMNAAGRFLEEKGVDFGVLWTGSPAFYERAGWFASDRGLFGEARRGAAAAPASAGGPAVSRRSPGDVDAAWMEAARSRWVTGRVVRNAVDYRATPIPAERVTCFVARGADGAEGFALAGEEERVGYFYEIAAPPALWEAIWADVSGRFDRLYVNGRMGDDFSRRLADTGRVAWRPRNKAMWLAVSEDVKQAGLNWHIPYFDWI